jgi:tape measure domain-containing protein
MAGRDAGYTAMLARSQAATQQTAGAIQTALGRVEMMAGRAMATVAQLGVSLSGVGFAKSAVEFAASAEQAEISFGVMLRSADRGKEMFRQLQTLAAETPLRTTDVVNATRTLLQFGVAGDQVIPIMRKLGDVVGGDVNRFQRIALAFGEVAAAGRVQGHEILMMVRDGWNPLQEISEITGKTMVKLREEMHHGGITYDMLVAALNRATGAGGRFENLMQRQSRTIGGLFSTLQDNVQIAMRYIGEEIVRGFDLRNVIRSLSDAAQATEGWLQGLSPNIKNAALAIAGATAAVTAFGVAWGVVSLLVNSSLAGLPLIAGLVVTAAAAVVGWNYSFVELRKMAVAAYDEIKAQTLAFVQWSAPVWQAVGSLAGTTWELIKTGAAAAWKFVKEAWAGIVGDTTVDWNRVRDTIRDAILGAEFALLNFRQVAGVGWTFIQLKAAEAAESVLRTWTTASATMYGYFAGVGAAGVAVVDEMIPSWRGWANTTLDTLQAVQGAAVGVFTAVGAFFLNRVEMMARAWGPAGAVIIAGLAQIQAMADRAGEAVAGPGRRALDVARQGLGQIAAEQAERFARSVDRIIGRSGEAFGRARDQANQALSGVTVQPTVDRLRREWEAGAGALGQSFEDFRRDRLRQFGEPGFVPKVKPEAVKEAETAAAAAGAVVGSAFATRAAHEVHKFDAALAGSAEAASRVLAYHDLLARTRPPAAPPPPAASEDLSYLGLKTGPSFAGLRLPPIPEFDPGLRSPAGRGEFGPPRPFVGPEVPYDMRAGFVGPPAPEPADLSPFVSPFSFDAAFPRPEFVSPFSSRAAFGGRGNDQRAADPAVPDLLRQAVAFLGRIANREAVEVVPADLGGE